MVVGWYVGSGYESIQGNWHLLSVWQIAAELQQDFVSHPQSFVIVQLDEGDKSNKFKN